MPAAAFVAPAGLMALMVSLNEPFVVSLHAVMFFMTWL